MNSSAAREEMHSAFALLLYNPIAIRMQDAKNEVKNKHLTTKNMVFAPQHQKQAEKSVARQSTQHINAKREWAKGEKKSDEQKLYK